MQKKIETVKTLLEALPFIKQFNGEKIVIKYGGSAQTSPELKQKFAEDLVLMQLVGIKPIVIHGGGKMISELLSELNIQTEFIDGHRVTSPKAMKVVEMVLSGEINKGIVSLLNHYGAKAIGISGKDASFMVGETKNNYGLTGQIKYIKSDVIDNLINDGFIPVIAPIASGEEIGHCGYNINADIVASEVAIALKVKKILFLTDTKGVLDKNKDLIHSLNEDKIKELKKDKIIIGGMIPKVDACLKAVKGGVDKAHIIDGRVEHSLLLEIFTTSGVGTEITLS